MSQLKNRIDAKFPIKDQGPIYFWLNMYFIRNRSERTIMIHQQAKIEKLISDMELDTYSQTKIPADPNTKLSKDHCPSTQEEQDNMAGIPYKSIIGELLYLGVTARPDIIPAVSQVSKFWSDELGCCSKDCFISQRNKRLPFKTWRGVKKFPNCCLCGC
jgi:hypothetical protein